MSQVNLTQKLLILRYIPIKFLNYKINIPLYTLEQKMKSFTRGKCMDWFHNSPQPHLKIKFKDSMPLTIFKEEETDIKTGKGKEEKGRK